MVTIKIPNRVLYSFIVIAIIVAIIGVVYAVAPSPGHTASEIGSGTMTGPINISLPSSFNGDTLYILQSGKASVILGSLSSKGYIGLLSEGVPKFIWDTTGITFPDGTKQTSAALKCGWTGWSSTCITACGGWCEMPGDPKTVIRCDTGTLQVKVCNTGCIRDPYC